MPNRSAAALSVSEVGGSSISPEPSIAEDRDATAVQVRWTAVAGSELRHRCGRMKQSGARFTEGGRYGTLSAMIDVHRSAAKNPPDPTKAIVGVLAFLAALTALFGIRRDLDHDAPVRPAVAAATEAVVPIDFSRDVRPILSGKCFACHGPDPATRKAGLRLDTKDGMQAILPSGHRAVSPGQKVGSALVARIRSTNPDFSMPEKSSKKSLTPREIAILERWIDEGAEFTDHWSFRPISDPPRPAVKNAAWCRNDLDVFVLARLEKEGLTPSPEAPRETLLRRVAFDLTGLPPTEHEMDEFLSDPHPDAYERAVRRFLDSPRYGEHQAKKWLDLARYSDTKGYESDGTRTIWPYRDWLIRAFNSEMGYDRFTIAQLAGDLLPQPAYDDLVATAFHRNTMTNDEGGTDDEEFRTAAIVDRTNTTAHIWLGLTMACAQCHTHKYDPISHTDYYRFFAYFNQTEDADRPDESPTIEYPQAGSPESRPAGDPGRAQLPIMRELAGDKRRVTRRLQRGSFLSPAENVEPGIPEIFQSTAPRAPTNRLELALWFFADAQTLTARVAVNREWEAIFGRGLVETTDDFGAQGSAPSHPELLDHLASLYRRIGWKKKQLLFTVVTSATYRQSSAMNAALREKDPENRLLARGPRFRLDAESLRDQALSVSGLLSQKMFGPPVYPVQPDGLWQIIYSGDSWTTSTGEDAHRRSIYTFWRRTIPYPLEAAFDAPTRDVCVSRRIRTNTPLQALQTLNDPAFHECARELGKITATTNVPSDADRARALWRRVLLRDPTPQEADRIVRLVATQKSRATTDAAGEFAWTEAATVLLNLDETLTKE